jgi:hypothetical protein
MKDIIIRITMLMFVSCAMTCKASVLVIPDAAINELSHSFGHFFPAGPATKITDEPTNGQFTLTSFTTMLTGSEVVEWSFEAPAGKMFVVHTPPNGFTNVSLSVFCQWWGGTSDSMKFPVSTSYTFKNLIGPTPSHTSTNDIMGSGGRLIQFSDAFSMAPGIMFTGVKVSAQYNFSAFNSTTQQFNPQSFRFAASAVSATQTLGDGILMTLEPLPALQMNVNPAGPGFSICWPTNFNSWTLESATELENSNAWPTVTNGYVIVGTNYIMTNMYIGPARYYRLRSQ